MVSYYSGIIFTVLEVGSRLFNFTPYFGLATISIILSILGYFLKCLKGFFWLTVKLSHLILTSWYRLRLALVGCELYISSLFEFDGSTLDWIEVVAAFIMADVLVQLNFAAGKFGSNSMMAAVQFGWNLLVFTRFM